MENILKNSRWRMHRMGLVDFWYYTDEEFYFENGHMLLRGSNGSGKSVTLQSIIPLLLDGNKSSERLDSFGTRARKMETYLINEESDRNDRIGYLYLEFKREDSEIYKTIGMGLRARKNKPLESWYFVIEDNRRIKYDIKLFDKGLAITKQSLKNIIGDQLIDQQKDYLSRVNKALFGFDDINDYKETINLLVQLRSPKLSNSLKPTLINEILNNSLQPLSEEDLRPMSEAIANLDEIEDQLSILKQSYQAAKQIYNHYDQYNYYCLDTKANIALNKRNKVYSLKKDIDKLIEDKNNNLKRQEEIINDKKNLEIENDTLSEELKIVDNPELYKLSEDLGIKKNQLTQTQIELEKKLTQEDNKYEKYLDVKKKVKEYQEKLDEIHLKIDNIIEEMDDIQDDICFDEHYALKEEMYNNLKDSYDYTYIFNKIETEIKRINEALIIFDNIKKENTIIERINNEIETNEVYIENIENKIKKYIDELYELINQMVESFSLWNDTNNYLKISKDDMFNIINILQEFEYEDNYNKIEEIIANTYNNLYQELSSNKVQKKIELENAKHERLNTESELNHWETLKDVIPNEDEYMKSNRKYLDEEGIKYQSFYSLLEFDENIDDSYKNNFEEMISRMGILNALVVNEDDRYKVLKTKDGLADSYLFTTKNVDELEICYINESKDLIDILEELSIDNSSIEIINGIYQNGIITGTISKQVKSIYIGKHSREQYRKVMIDELKEKLANINDDIENKKSEIDKLERDIDSLNNERMSYPRKDSLVEIKDEIKLSNLELDKINEQIKIKKEELLKKRLIVKEYNLNVTQIAEKLGIPCLENVFYDRKENFKAYQKELNNLKIEHIVYISNNELYCSHNNELENLDNDLDTIRYEKNNLESDIKKLESQIISLEKQLEDKNYGDKKRRIIKIKDRLNEIKVLIEEYTFKLGNIESSIKQNIDNLAIKEEEYTIANSEYDYSYNIYLEELALGYVSEEELELDDVHGYVCDKYPKLDKKETINNNLQTSFHTNKGSLNEYRINLISIFDDDAQRLDIVARFQGNNIKFNKLLNKLETLIEDQKLLFDERDRYLVEEILVNTLSSKIRQHIQSSRKWIEKMNQHMDSMKTSSGLNISLKWHAHKGQNEDELNSNELVTLLEKDTAIWKESDSKKVSSHFRSKIKTARQLSEMEGNRASFHQIMKDIMDYRSWFDFEMWYQKMGENKKEMTNNAFFAFSGGEKAMAMYIPLFSAVAAKYDQAKEDTPMIIALDEAFAGVDEKNIDNLFALIDKFKFDYIMNSQVLWGDYQSVKSLAIHELFRPENAHYVTVISYKWNGKSKSMVNDIWA